MSNNKHKYHLIGKRIKKARENKNITQEDLASMIDCSPNHISVIERGIKYPKLITFIKIVNSLDITPNELLKDVINYKNDFNNSDLQSLFNNTSELNRQRILKIIEILLDTEV